MSYIALDGVMLWFILCLPKDLCALGSIKDMDTSSYHNAIPEGLASTSKDAVSLALDRIMSAHAQKQRALDV